LKKEVATAVNLSDKETKELDGLLKRENAGIKVEAVIWNVYNIKHIYEMLHFVSEKFYGVSCSQCKTNCCANQALEVQTDDLKKLAKHLKMKPIDFRKRYTKTKENYIKSMAGGAETGDSKGKMMMSDRMKEVMKQPGRFIMLEMSEDKAPLDAQITTPDGKTHKEGDVMYCPFYEKGTHLCKVHEVRPQACKDYPFQKYSDDTIEVRKVTACLITDKFLERFIEFYSTFPNENAKQMVDALRKVQASKKYYNHFNLPWALVIAQLAHEFNAHGMAPLALGLMKRLELEEQMMEREAAKKQCKKK
jgi:Fe-S-cluster containining protein